jgi:hypothetical protein
MPGIAKNVVRENLGYVESIAKVQSSADVSLRAKQAKAKQARLEREATERRTAAENPDRDAVAYIEKHSAFFKPLYPLVEHERFKGKACVEFRELYIEKYGKATDKEAREARRPHFKEQFELWFARNYGKYTKECQDKAHGDAFAIYNEEIARGVSLGSFQDTYEHAQLAYLKCRDSKLPPKFSVAHYVRAFHQMDGDTFANILRTGENASRNMVEGAKIVYKERKAEIDAISRNNPFPRASAQPSAEP